jgi:6-phosphogluconate dehydrogenase
MVGLGKMGMNMARRLLRGGHEVVAYNRSPEKSEQLQEEDGGVPALSLGDLVDKLDAPRVVWIMLPEHAVKEHIHRLLEYLDRDDVIVEGGNSNFHEDSPNAQACGAKGVHYLDVGVSGGIWGLSEGYCMMIGGDKQIAERIDPIFATLAPTDGYIYCGPTGAGHFVKMVHNGIEYGLMQAYAEGFQLLETSNYGKFLDYAELSKVWNHGSVIRSWLLELAAEAFKHDARLENIEGWVDDSGEGRWAVEECVNHAVPAPVITAALFERFRSRMDNTFGDRVLAALRREFGGHAVKKSD